MMVDVRHVFRSSSGLLGTAIGSEYLLNYRSIPPIERSGRKAKRDESEHAWRAFSRQATTVISSYRHALYVMTVSHESNLCPANSPTGMPHAPTQNTVIVQYEPYLLHCPRRHVMVQFLYRLNNINKTNLHCKTKLRLSSWAIGFSYHYIERSLSSARPGLIAFTLELATASREILEDIPSNKIKLLSFYRNGIARYSSPSSSDGSSCLPCTQNLRSSPIGRTCASS